MAALKLLKGDMMVAAPTWYNAVLLSLLLSIYLRTDGGYLNVFYLYWGSLLRHLSSQDFPLHQLTHTQHWHYYIDRPSQ